MRYALNFAYSKVFLSKLQKQQKVVPQDNLCTYYVEQNLGLLAGGALVTEGFQQVFGRTDGIAHLLGVCTESLRLGIEFLRRQGTTEM